MVGIPVDLLWFESLDFSMGEKKQIKTKKTRKGRRREEMEIHGRKLGHPHPHHPPFWLDLP